MSTENHQDVLERIRRGFLHCESETAFQGPERRDDEIFEYTQTPPSQTDRRRTLLEAIFASLGERTILNSPFHAAFGSHTSIGDDFFGNANISFIDDAEILIGNAVMIASNVTLATTGHPVHPDCRVDFARFSEPIHLEDKVWIGANAVVLPGVRVGYGSVVGAGSVVTHDVPPMTIVAGVPARVLRPITAADLRQRKPPTS